MIKTTVSIPPEYKKYIDAANQAIIKGTDRLILASAAEIQSEQHLIDIGAIDPSARAFMMTALLKKARERQP